MNRRTAILGTLVVVTLLAVALATLTGGRKQGAASSNPFDGDGLDKGAYLGPACDMPPSWIQRIKRGYRPGPAQGRDLIIVPKPPNYVGGLISTTHSGPYDFLQKVPLTFYGPGFVKELGPTELDREATLADVAPTYARLMRFDFPDRKGIPLSELLMETKEKPRLILTAVIDGGGWNALEHWPDAWPNIKRLIERGANVEGAIVGSSPSVTPATHTNISTGAFPRQHGATAIHVRKDGGQLVGAFTRHDKSAGADVDPSITLRMATLADLYDRALDNVPEVALIGFGNYITGMVGHGAELDGADKDIVAFEEHEHWATDSEYYSLPVYLNTEVPSPEADLRSVDLSDGAADGKWRGHEIAPLDATPAYAPWQNRAIKALITREGFGQDDVTDLFYLNYKAPDAAGHKWNMIGPEQEDVIRSTDEAIGDLVDFLDRLIGEEEYVLVVTADHGQTPLEAGGWPIYREEMLKDLARAFDDTNNQTGLVESTTATTIFLRASEMKANQLTPEELAAFLSEYTIEDNIGEQEYPKEFDERKEEKVFSAVFPGRQLPEIIECSEAGT